MVGVLVGGSDLLCALAFVLALHPLSTGARSTGLGVLDHLVGQTGIACNCLFSFVVVVAFPVLL